MSASNHFDGEAGAAVDMHELYRELAALATAGELSREERRALADHLAVCADCRRLAREYEEVARVEMPALGAAIRIPAATGSASWDVASAEERLLISLPGPQPARRKRVFTGVRPWWVAAAAVALIAVATAGYQVGRLRERDLFAIASMRLGPGLPVASTGPAVPSAQPPARNNVNSSELRRAQQQLVSEREHAELLEGELARLQSEIGQDADALAQAKRERNALNQQLTQARASAADLEGRLRIIGDEKTAQQTAAAVLTGQIHDLEGAVDAKDREIAREQALLDRDRDIRNLVGARNLYIAEIYDVAKDGVNQKPFGRVFYTKDRSLVFYGYDLDQQRGIPRDAAFQAWGRRGADPGRDVSLGLLYQDDAHQKRWILKCDDAKTISQMDAIFVTVEPEGGSAKPTGKPLLFTYLRLDPNHP